MRMASKATTCKEDPQEEDDRLLKRVKGGHNKDGRWLMRDKVDHNKDDGRNKDCQ